MLQKPNIVFTKSKFDKLREKMKNIIAKKSILPKSVRKSKPITIKLDHSLTCTNIPKKEEVALSVATDTVLRHDTVQDVSPNTVKCPDTKRKSVDSKPRLHFKKPKTCHSYSSTATKVEDNDRSSTSITSLQLENKSNASNGKNWNIDTKGITVDDLKKSLSQDFNNHYQNKYGKLPTRVELASRGFGRPSKKHCFTSDVVFDHILLVLYKSNYLTKIDISNLHKTNLLYGYLHQSLQKALTVNFTDINKPDPNYMDQAEITQEKKEKFLAAALFYDFHLGSVMRYAGENYSGEFRNTKYITQRV